LRPARLLEALDATTNLGGDFVQTFAAFLQDFSWVDGAHIQNAPGANYRE
jgi:hypothetical protein